MDCRKHLVTRMAKQIRTGLNLDFPRDYQMENRWVNQMLMDSGMENPRRTDSKMDYPKVTRKDLR